MNFKNLRLKFLNETFDLNVDVNKAAVSILLYDNNGELETLYIKRTFNPMDPWSGQVAFPGGKCKSVDRDLIETAIRETYEELGFKIDRGSFIGVLGVFKPLNKPILNVYPIIFGLDSKPETKFSREVRDCKWIPLKKMSIERRIINGNLVEGYVYGDYFIWGLTARITEKFMKFL